MQKRGFDMYTTKRKQPNTIYSYKPRFENYQETEMQVYIGRKASKDIAHGVNSGIKKMTTDILRSLSAKGRY